MFRSLLHCFRSLILSLGMAAIAPAFADSAAAAPPAHAYVLRVDGLACPFCAYGVEKEFARQPGVENTDVDLHQGVLVVMVKPGTRFTDAQLAQVVHAAGFALKAVVSRPMDAMP
ncbi:MAG: heavy-metal-associated domain-containing protein [Xanthomonadaceae bacterium]|nr:heavy-metal-associated domain-containing protein [Xanthomonadaceae bacterium]MDE2278171.1 heavy-metal-associated domain-containing protein [Xanthomonadaceae bacterium]MDE2316547.1 heavy-metal-associated domain-containing protein [Xanthomonadaceae bacterium]